MDEAPRCGDCVRRSMANIVAFIPEQSKREFRFALPHAMGMTYGITLRNMLKAAAPEIKLTFDTTSRPHDLEAKLRNGDIHMAVDWIPIDAGWCVHEKLFDDRMVVIAREGHPRIKGHLTLDDLRREELVDLNPRVEAEHEPPGVREFHTLGKYVGFHVNEIFELLPVVLGSDMLSVFPESGRRYLEGRGYQVLPFPTAISPLRINLLWNEKYRRDGGHAWIRKLLKEAVISVSRGTKGLKQPGSRAGHPYVSRQLVAA